MLKIKVHNFYTPSTLFKYIPDTDKLPYNYKDENNLLKDLRIKAFKKNDVNCLDLRDAIRDNVEYYKTDHHWTVELFTLQKK